MNSYEIEKRSYSMLNQIIRSNNLMDLNLEMTSGEFFYETRRIYIDDIMDSKKLQLKESAYLIITYVCVINISSYLNGILSNVAYYKAIFNENYECIDDFLVTLIE